MQAYICGYYGKGWGAKVIRWFSFSKFCHVSYLFDNGVGAPEEIEAIQGKGVHSQRFNDSSSNHVLFQIPCTVTQAENLHMWATAQLKKKYDWMGLRAFYRRKRTENPNKWFCSELVAAGMKLIDLPLLRKEAWKMDPDLVCASTVISPIGKDPEHWSL